MNQKTQEFEERLIQFALSVTQIAESLPKTNLGRYIRDQLTRSGLSSSFNYGEAQFAESKLDFIHKLKICLKELKEVHISLKFVRYKPLIDDSNKIIIAEIECCELISIFVKSVETTRRNMLEAQLEKNPAS